MEYYVHAVNLERRIGTRFGGFTTRLEAETQCRVLRYGPWKSIEVVAVPEEGSPAIPVEAAPAAIFGAAPGRAGL